MDCRDVIAQVLSMDNDSSISPEAAAHLRECSACRIEADRLAVAVATLRIDAEDVAIEELPDGRISADALTERVMQAVRREATLAAGTATPRDASAEEQPARMRSWLIAGALILGGLFGLRFSDVMNWLRASFGPALDVAMSVILGLFLTGYICILVASNLARVRRVFRLR